MKRICVYVAADSTNYIPAPCKGVVAGVKVVWQDTVTTSNICTVSRDATTVNLTTAVTTAGLVVETGVPDTTNKGLIFDPASSTAAYQVIKAVLSGGSSTAAVLLIEFDDFAYVAQAASEA